MQYFSIIMAEGVEISVNIFHVGSYAGFMDIFRHKVLLLAYCLHISLFYLF